MGEAHPADRAGNLRYDARVHRLVEKLEDRVPFESADAGQRIEIELASEHGGQHEQLVALVREMAQAAADHLPHALWDRQRGGLRFVKTVLSGEQPQNLADEEGISLCLGVDGRGEVSCGRAGCGELQEAGDVGLGEAGELEALRDRLARELHQGRPQRIGEGGIDVAVRADDQ